MLKIVKSFPFLVLIVLMGLSIISCNLGNNENDDFVAREMADSIVNRENGMVAQLNDVANLFGGDSETVPSRSTIIISTENGELTTFVWDAENEWYERTGTNLDINIDDILIGTINTFTSTCKFFTSSDPVGPGVEVNPDNTIPTNVHSMIHTRDIDTSITNINRNVDKEIVIDADYAITGINDTTCGVTVTGTRTATGDTMGQYFDGSWVKTINIGSITVVRQRDGNTVTYTYVGDAVISFEGTYSDIYGNTREISDTATVHFNGTRYVTITIDGSTITINITTGEEV